MRKKQIYAFTASLYRKLRNPKFVVKLYRDKKSRGQYWTDRNRIDLDPRNEIISTLIHEVSHAIWPKLTENQIIAKENEIIHKLSHKQIANIVYELGVALKRSYWEL